MLLYACTIFLSAFLLFQVQPLIAKMILPWFGGSAAVWTACVLFFQLLLLLGYLYAHWTIRYLRPKIQTMLHLGLLTASVLVLPAIPNPAWKPEGGEDPTLRIFGLLAATVGLPYFLLSTTGPLVQAWFVRDRRKPGATPYRLYALSNLGSMLALMTYPVLVEPFLATRIQGYTWSAAYLVFVLFCGLTSWRVRDAKVPYVPLPREAPSAVESPSAGLMLIWIGLAACASTLLLAVTNHLSQNVAAIPFLWVLPLALYLLSFILCFNGDGWYKRQFFLGLFAVALAGMAYALFADVENMPLVVALPLFSIGLFVCCMVCHGELARLKPDPRHLTLFYLMVSIGGAIGGVFVGLIAPNVFSGFYELPVGLAACALFVLLALRRDLFRDAVWRPDWLLSVAYVLALAFYVGRELKRTEGHNRLAVRNFYGGLKVSDSGSGREAERTLTHGTINHGQQFLSPDRRRLATTYYGPNTGVGLAIRALDPDAPHHIGVIGLGTGTLAAYGRLGAGDRITFFEINPLVIQIAHSQFTFLMDSQAKVEIVLGDARLSLERQQPPEMFDVLAVDAFSSDSIPVHLLTIEAFRLYFRRLKPDGVLAVHISNKYLDLNPIVQLAAKALGKRTKVIDTDDDDDSGVFGATWVLVASDPHFFDKSEFHGAGPSVVARNVRLWTDDYSNLLRILKR
jgi:SAM-dependent methyltransferase